MEHIIEYIKSYHSYRENECLMQYFISEDKTYIELKVIDAILYLSFLCNFEFKLKKEKKIMGKNVIPFKYKNREGDIMTYLDKYILITLYPNDI